MAVRPWCDLTDRLSQAVWQEGAGPVDVSEREVLDGKIS
jgi:hypothetical protein